MSPLYVSFAPGHALSSNERILQRNEGLSLERPWSVKRCAAAIGYGVYHETTIVKSKAQSMWLAGLVDKRRFIVVIVMSRVLICWWQTSKLQLLILIFVLAMASTRYRSNFATVGGGWGGVVLQDVGDPLN